MAQFSLELSPSSDCSIRCAQLSRLPDCREYCTGIANITCSSISCSTFHCPNVNLSVLSGYGVNYTRFACSDSIDRPAWKARRVEALAHLGLIGWHNGSPRSNHKVRHCATGVASCPMHRISHNRASPKTTPRFPHAVYGEGCRCCCRDAGIAGRCTARKLGASAQNSARHRGSRSAKHGAGRIEARARIGLRAPAAVNPTRAGWRIRIVPTAQPCDCCANRDGRKGHDVPIRIQLVDRIVEGIAIAVRADALLGDLEPVGLQEQAELGVVIAGVQILQARVVVITLAAVRGAYAAPSGATVPPHPLVSGRV
jgi:hypothetical protein